MYLALSSQRVIVMDAFWSWRRRSLCGEHWAIVAVLIAVERHHSSRRGLAVAVAPAVPAVPRVGPQSRTRFCATRKSERERKRKRKRSRWRLPKDRRPDDARLRIFLSFSFLQSESFNYCVLLLSACFFVLFFLLLPSICFKRDVAFVNFTQSTLICDILK